MSKDHLSGASEGAGASDEATGDGTSGGAPGVPGVPLVAASPGDWTSASVSDPGGALPKLRTAAAAADPMPADARRPSSRYEYCGTWGTVPASEGADSPGAAETVWGSVGAFDGACGSCVAPRDALPRSVTRYH